MLIPNNVSVEFYSASTVMENDFSFAAQRYSDDDVVGAHLGSRRIGKNIYYYFSAFKFLGFFQLHQRQLRWLQRIKIKMFLSNNAKNNVTP